MVSSRLTGLSSVVARAGLRSNRIGSARPTSAGLRAQPPQPPPFIGCARCFASTSRTAFSSSSAFSLDGPATPSDHPAAHHGAFEPQSHRCGQLSELAAGQDVVLAGWLDSLRIVSKQLGFLILRDHTGTVQIKVQANQDKQMEALIASVSNLPLQSVILAEGRVQMRPEADRNPSQPSGSIEVHLSSLQLLNPARRDLPFLPSDSEHADRVSPDLRAKYRYLDLRRPALGNSIRLRSKVAQSIRSHLYAHDFLEIETPILLRSTPEGAREFLVPTRISATASTAGSAVGDKTAPAQRRAEPSFYALPQSPQQPKQLLIASGVTDRYFQIAKCFRDEDGRKDRQPEFTQVDIEMGFISGGPPPENGESAATVSRPANIDARDAQGKWRIGGWQVRDVIEVLVADIWATAGRGSLDHLYTDAARKRGFPVLSYWTAMTTYGSDKPDLRYGLRISDISEGFQHHDADSDSHHAALASESGGLALEILPHHHTSAGKLSNKELEALLFPFKGRVERFRLASWQNTNELAALLLKKSQNVRTFLSGCDDLAASQVDVDRLSARLREVLASSRASEGITDDETNSAVDVYVSSRPSPPEGGSTALGDVRKSLAAALSAKGLLAISDKPQFAWITEFPLFTLADDDKNQLSLLSSGAATAAARWQSSHHPFTAPMAEDAHILGQKVDRSQVGRVRGQHYDLVLDGQEIGGGSVRIHDAAMQRRVFTDVLELTASEVGRFGHLLHALSCGAPPHAGIALGFDRLMAILCGSTSIRDVIPFPKMGSGVDPVFGSPSTIDDVISPVAEVEEKEKGAAGKDAKTEEVLRMYALRPL